MPVKVRSFVQHPDNLDQIRLETPGCTPEFSEGGVRESETGVD